MPIATSRMTDPNIVPPAHEQLGVLQPASGQHRDTFKECQCSSFNSPQKGEMPAEAGIFSLHERTKANLVCLWLRLGLRHGQLLSIYRSHFRTVIASEIPHARKLLLLYFKRALHHHYNR